MTVHVVCMDGTNQARNQPNPTNIALLFAALGGTATDDSDGSAECASAGVAGKYLPGVGAQGHPALRILGNLFGDGIAEPIIRGYTFLSRVYQSGDGVVILGFSRGATAARALAGWVVKQGLLDRSRYDVGDKDGAYRRAIAAWYRYRKGSPDLANQARLRFIGGLLGRLPQLAAADFTAKIGVDVVGVFDTVSSLGLPTLDVTGAAVFDFSICDTELNPGVARGVHALAADEVRELFTPTFWADRGASIIQQIFPGGHSDVGGGYPQHGLSDTVLDWMAGQLNAVHPVFDLRRLPRPLAADPLAQAHDESRMFPFLATPHRARAFPHIAVPSAALTQRLRHPAAVLPGALVAPYTPTGRYADGSALV